MSKIQEIEDLPFLITLPLLAEFMGVSVRSLQYWHEKGRLTFTYVGVRCRRVRKDDLKEFLSKCRRVKRGSPDAVSTENPP